MRVVEKSIVASAPESVIFRIYEDVESWSLWDPDTRSAKLGNGLKLHSIGHLTPAKGRTVPMEVTSIVEGRSFTVSSKTTLFRLDFKHELEAVISGTLITHRVTFSGLLSPVLARMVGKPLEKSLPITLKNLKQRAERAHSPHG